MFQYESFHVIIEDVWLKNYKDWSRNMTKRKHMIVTLGLSLMLGLSACSSNAGTKNDANTNAETNVTEDSQAEDETEDEAEETISPYYTFEDKNDNNLAAMFFIGSGNQEMNDKMPAFLEKYGLTQDVFEMVAEKDNCEWYAIIPKYIGTKIKVERVELNDDGNMEVTEKITETEKPVLLCCNESDIIASAKVTITYGDEELEFNPFLSLENGKLAKVERVYTE